MGSPRQMRVSDADRDQTVRQLSDAHTVGRLTVVEFEQRMSAALAARTVDDLARLVEDLPAHADLRRLRDLTDQLLATAAELGVSRAQLVTLLAAQR